MQQYDFGFNKQFNIPNFNKTDSTKRRKKHIKKQKVERHTYRIDKKEEIREYRKEYRKSHKKEIKEYRIANKKRDNETRKKRLKRDPIYHLMVICSHSVYMQLKSKGFSKNGKSSKYLFPFTGNELKIHIEKQFSLPENLDKNGKVWMTWENQGVYNTDTWGDNDSFTWKWNLDHIIPHSKLSYSSLDDEKFRLCWALSNLRPYSAKQNILDGNRR